MWKQIKKTRTTTKLIHLKAFYLLGHDHCVVIMCSINSFSTRLDAINDSFIIHILRPKQERPATAHKICLMVGLCCVSHNI